MDSKTGDSRLHLPSIFGKEPEQDEDDFEGLDQEYDRKRRNRIWFTVVILVMPGLIAALAYFFKVIVQYIIR
ncbi:MAG: hypothetical protein ACOX7R_12295 [Acetivibrionales bacterium]|jgi:hypothetical protein